MRRRAILVVEYTVRQDAESPPARTPDAATWERGWGGNKLKDLHVEVQEDKAWP